MQFKGEHRPPTPEIAKLLNVDAVIEGSVARLGSRQQIIESLHPDDLPNSRRSGGARPVIAA